jgi:hypothetical protein
MKISAFFSMTSEENAAQVNLVKWSRKAEDKGGF